MKKTEAEPAVRSLATTWARETDAPLQGARPPSFSDFVSWMRARGYGHYLEFRSLRGPLADAEDWFDQELRQTWRN